MEVMLIKSPTGALIPFSDEDRDALAKVKTGDAVRVDVVRVRNPQFLKKFFCLVRFLFDIWQEGVKPKTYRGQEVKPNLERFRKDLIILAGHYEASYSILGDVRLQAKSISFAKMTEEEFEDLYSQVINVALTKVIDRPDLDEARVRHLVAQIMQYD